MHSFNRTTTGREVVEAFADRLEGKTVLITGPSAGSIGAETAISIAYANPSQILLAGRTVSKAAPVIQKIHELNPNIRTKFIHIDLASQSSVRKAAAEINESVDKLDYLINNAGIIAVPTFQTSEDGIELQFASNHIGHFLLTNLLMEKILAAGKGARIVNVSSTGFELNGIRFDDVNFQSGKEYGPWQAYAQSKTANVLFAAGLAEKLKNRGIQAFSVQPGIVPASNLATHITPDMWTDAMQLASESSGGKITELEAPKTTQEGCSTTLVAVLDPSIEDASGRFLQDCVVRPIEQDYAKGRENMDRLWALSEKLVGQDFDL